MSPELRHIASSMGYKLANLLVYGGFETSQWQQKY